MPMFSYEGIISFGPDGPRLSFSDHFMVESYTKIGIAIPAGIDLAEVVPECDDWIEPEPEEVTVDEIDTWEDVPILLNEFNNSPTKVKVQPSETENVSAMLIISDSFDNLYYTVDDGLDIFELAGPILLIGAGNIGLFGNSAKDFTFYNLGATEANVTFLVARNAIR